MNEEFEKCLMEIDKFITEIQVEEVYTDQQQQELNEYYEWLNNQNEQEPDQSGRQSLCSDDYVWEL